MKEKIVVFLILNLLIFSTTSIALTPFNINEQQDKQGFFDKSLNPLLTSNRWIKIFGGFGEDCGYSVQQTYDDGYIIAGYTGNIGQGGNVWLIKTDKNGNKVWDKTYGGKEGDQAYSVQQTFDNGYILAGLTNYSGGGADSDIWLIKTDENGNMLWDKIFGGIDRDEAYSVEQTSDNGYIIAGMTFSYGVGWVDAWLIKTDENGDEQWNKTYGGIQVDMAKSVQQTSDGGYIAAGVTFSFNEGDIWLIKTDVNGDTMWNKTFGGTDFDEAHSVQQTSDNGYIIAGTTSSFGAGDKDFWLIKTDEYGNKTWDKTYGGKEGDQAYSVQQTSDNGYIIAGKTSSFGAENTNVWLVKTDADGNKIWDRTIGGKYGDIIYSIEQTSDNGYIMTGETGSFGDANGDLWLIKTDSQGKPKTISLDNMWFEKLVQRFPFMLKILNQIL